MKRYVEDFTALAKKPIQPELEKAPSVRPRDSTGPDGTPIPPQVRPSAYLMLPTESKPALFVNAIVCYGTILFDSVCFLLPYAIGNMLNSIVRVVKASIATVCHAIVRYCKRFFVFLTHSALGVSTTQGLNSIFKVISANRLYLSSLHLPRCRPIFFLCSLDLLHHTHTHIHAQTTTHNMQTTAYTNSHQIAPTHQQRL